jgi:hypothetical protein
MGLGIALVNFKGEVLERVADLHTMVAAHFISPRKSLRRTRVWLREEASTRLRPLVIAKTQAQSRAGSVVAAGEAGEMNEIWSIKLPQD